MSEINAAQARASSEASAQSADEIVKQFSRSIEANSRTGATSVTQILAKEAVSDSELQRAMAMLEARGFKVEPIAATAAQHTIAISW
jgi:hypothetical protein